MQGSTSRSVVVISGLITLLILGGLTLAVSFQNGWLRTASDDRAAGQMEVSAQGASSGTTAAGPRDETAVYRQKLEEAYRALDEAYAQIRALQSAQTRFASRSGSDDDDDHRERRTRRHDSGDDE